MQASKKAKPSHELKRSSSFDKTWEESVAESVANELLEQMQSLEQEELSKPKSKDSKKASKTTKASKTGHSGQEEKKSGKATSDKKGKPEVLREFHNIKISQVGIQEIKTILSYIS